MQSEHKRYLLITADDFGIGPETSRGILDLAARGLITSTVLLVNSPFAEDAVSLWEQSGCELELGWHPCLTLDRPLLSPKRVPSLVDEHGQFLSLGRLLKRLLRGQVQAAEVEAEFQAQLDRFVTLVGHWPKNVNAHHHIHIFEPIGRALRAVLSRAENRTYLRRVQEPIRTVTQIRGARFKRLLLNWFGARATQEQHQDRFPGNDVLLGVTDPPYVHDPEFFLRWLRLAPGRFVELTCHPGFLDLTLNGRDGSLTDGQLHRREQERNRLGSPEFRATVTEQGFTLVTAQEMSQLQHEPTILESRIVRNPKPRRSHLPLGTS